MKQNPRGPIAWGTAIVLFLVLALAPATPACAATVINQRPLLFSFDGSDTTAGKFETDISNDPNAYFKGLGQLAFDTANGRLYAIDATAGVVDRFDAEGNAQDFTAGPAAGMSSLVGPSLVEPFNLLAVDNSGGLGGPGEGEQGRLYVGRGGASPVISAFGPEGNFLWTISPEFEEKVLRGMTVDAGGHLWLSFARAETPKNGVLELDTTGSSTPSTTPIDLIETTSGTGLPAGLAFDKSGEDLYVANDAGENVGTAPKTLDKYVDRAFDSTVSSEPARAISVDQTKPNGHLFAVQGQTNSGPDLKLGSSLDEYEPCSSAGCGASLISASDAGLIGDGRGVAYNPVKDWVYISDHLTGTVKVFGPLASGPVPTTAIGETDEINKTEATVHGTVNPGGLPNSYHFELVRGEVQKLVVESPGGRFWLGTALERNRYPLIEPTPDGVTEALPFDISPTALQEELEPIFGAGNVEVTGTASVAGAPGEYRILFVNELAGEFVPKLRGIFVAKNQEEEELGEAYKGGVNPTNEEGKLILSSSPQGQVWAESEQLRTRPETYPSIEPADAANHAVSMHFSGLQPNTPYDVRLVGTNTEPEGNPEKRLDGYSSAATFTTEAPLPPDISGPSISSVTTESADLSAAIDSHEDETVWRIFLDQEAGYGAGQAECEALPLSAYELADEGRIPLGETSPVEVERELTGLRPAETVCVRVLATNGGGTGRGAAVFTTHAVKPSEAGLAFVAPRTDTSVRLNAYVNPEGGAPLTYRFEYSADGSNWTALPERVSTTSSHDQIVVGDELTGLAPSTTYFYRLGLVKNEAGQIPPSSLEEEGTFTTRSSAEMTIPANAFGEAEKRGFELVNKPDTGNQNARAVQLEAGGSPLRADGEEFLWTVLGGAPEANSGTQATFVAERGASGWTSKSLLPPAPQQVGGGGLTYIPYIATPDFSSFVFAPSEQEVINYGPPTLVRLDTVGNQQVLGSFHTSGILAVDATEDNSHILVVDPDTHELEDVGSGTREELSLIPGEGAPMGVPQPHGSAPACGLDPSGASFFGGSASGAGVQWESGYHRMSVTDASRVYFQVHPDSSYPGCGGPWAIYERNRQGESPTTTPVLPPALATADTEMIRATPDGRSLYFITSAKLASTDGNGHLDVYRWDEEAHMSSCLTCNVKNVLGRTITNANLETVGGTPAPVYVSDDFTHIYFNSPDRLVAGHGVQGGQNLYVLTGGKVHFVSASAPLGADDQLSADGNVLTFLSTSRLTADGIAARCPTLAQASGFSPCQELYRYDNRDGSIECVSCRHDGTTENSVSLSSFGSPFQASADGSTVVFTTGEKLVPGDVNNSADLYEWRNGAVRLLTDGVTRFPIGFAGPIPQAIDADGKNIIFSVASPGLTGFEQDRLANLYDARIGGGFAPPTAPQHCSEEACQGPLQAAPPSGQPGSSGYHGPGNAAPTRPCPKGKIRRHGRCVLRHRRHRGHCKHHRKGGRAHQRSTNPERGAGR